MLLNHQAKEMATESREKLLTILVLYTGNSARSIMWRHCSMAVPRPGFVPIARVAARQGK